MVAVTATTVDRAHRVVRQLIAQPAAEVNAEAPDVEAEEILEYVDATPVAEVELVEEVAE